MFSRETFAHDLPLVEVVFCRSDLLIRLVPLAAQHDHIPRAPLFEREGDGPAPLLDDGKGRSFRKKARQRAAQDGIGVLGAGIVAREDDKVRVSGGNARHEGALAFVPVAAAAKKRYDAPIGKGSDRGGDIF